MLDMQPTEVGELLGDIIWAFRPAGEPASAGRVTSGTSSSAELSPQICRRLTFLHLVLMSMAEACAFWTCTHLAPLCLYVRSNGTRPTVGCLCSRRNRKSQQFNVKVPCCILHRGLPEHFGLSLCCNCAGANSGVTQATRRFKPGESVKISNMVLTQNIKVSCNQPWTSLPC